MHDPQRIVDELRAALSTYAPSAVENLRALVAAYGEMSGEVNLRLQRCGELLRQGLRSEAIQLAEIEPKLLDLVATLDFPEREQMAPFLVQCGIAPPIPLLMTVAGDLNEAYAVEEPLRALLDRHRRLALSRAPLSERIGNLRMIAKTDSNNVVWQEDLQLYEQERMKQIEAEVGVAAQAGDAVALADLEDELSNDAWVERPPAALLHRATEARARHTRVQARDELDALEPQLNDAFAAFDIARARELRNRWNDALARAQAPANDATVERAGPALDWLTQEDEKDRTQEEYTAALAVLEMALDSDTPAAKLERLYHGAARFGLELPPSVERRVAARLQAAEVARSRRMRMLTVVAVAAILVVGIGVGYAVWQIMLNREITARSETLSAMLNEGKLQAAHDYLADVEANSPRVAASDEIQSLKVRLTDAIQQDNERAKQFTEVMAAIGSPENPNGSAVAQARKLAKTSAEKAQFAAIDSAITREMAKEQQKSDKKLMTELRAFAGQIAEFEQGVNTDTTQRAKQLNELQKVALELKAKSKNASDLIRAQLDPVLSRLESIQSALKRESKEQELITSAMQAIGDREAYVRRLNEFTSAFPQSPRSADFLRVTEEIGLLDTIDAWNGVTEDIGRKPVDSFDASEAAKAVERIKGVLEKHGGHPAAEAFRERLPYLNAVAQRIKDGERIEKALQSVFSNPLVADLFLVETAEGRFYTRQEPRIDGPVTTVKYLSSLDNTEKNRGVRKEEAVFHGPAPQRALAKAVRDRLRTLSDKTWDPVFYQIVSDIVLDKTTDALLRLQLLERTLEVACEGSNLLRQAFESYRSAIDEQKVNLFSNWLDPANDEANESRRKAEELFATLAATNEPAERIKKLLEVIHAPIGRSYIWTGMLLKDSAGKWRVASKRTVAAGDLYLIVQPVKDGPIEAHRIGAVEGGRFVVENVPAAIGVEGRPVFEADKSQ